MQRLSGGDDLALNEIMTRWQDKLTSFLWHMTHDHAATRDLVQESFVRLYMHRQRYRPHAPFSAYLFRIARNLLSNHIRWQSRHPAESLQTLSETGFDPSSEDPTPDQAMEEDETAREVRRAIASLPEDLREALVLFTYQGMTYRQMAEVFDCSEKAAETRLYRARQLLKEKLAPLVRE
ncbi:RNA polymerase sigma-70 factor (ECF subfamily) [Prosthecobacter fusiformis]|uniref:RNA polymerase sigma-70 factor (ECF subfamily) n=2 Tax=Prosthecobacter fusiformis TaxID=48464 RepID=A0A4R7RLD3_9BACT|nr:RNA polymerase sigma-70 factor (ECF subfamily) [Prosthecobacter fusiformis]